MEIGFFSYKWDERERFYSQSVLFFLLALGLLLWGHVVVHANPSSNRSIEEDSKVPLSKRVFDSSGTWRAPKKSKNVWRKPKQNKVTIQKDRIQRKTSSLYDPTRSHDNWDPYSSMGHPDTLTKPAKVFEFKF